MSGCRQLDSRPQFLLATFNAAATRIEAGTQLGGQEVGGLSGLLIMPSRFARSRPVRNYRLQMNISLADKQSRATRRSRPGWGRGVLWHKGPREQWSVPYAYADCDFIGFRFR